jgi:hypothetical protein
VSTETERCSRYIDRQQDPCNAQISKALIALLAKVLCRKATNVVEMSGSIQFKEFDKGGCSRHH